MPVRVQEKPKFKIKIKRNDQVIVIAGKDAGKKGRVLRVLAEKNRVLVEGVMMMKKHMKPNPAKEYQGRHCRAGSDDPSVECDATRFRGQQNANRITLGR